MRVNSKTGKPEVLIRQQLEYDNKINEFKLLLPEYLNDYIIFLKGSVSASTAVAYLNDIHFFYEYLLETIAVKFDSVRDIPIDVIIKLKARDINLFIGDYCRRYTKEIDGNLYLFENNNTSLSRKKSSLSSMFKFLFRNEQIPEDITGGFNPIKTPKRQPDSIKRLYSDEIRELINIVTTGENLSKKQKVFWEKTKYRDRAIILLFVTYGLRLSELASLNINSFHFERNEFHIYRKRDKESTMPLNNTTRKAVLDYLEYERPNTGDVPLFLSLQKKRMTRKAIRQMVKKYTSYVIGTSLDKGYSPHKLRATAASALIEKGFGIYEVQNLLDHENVTTTQIYAAHKKKGKEEIIKNFELDD